METRKFCVYNQTRESFLSLGVAVSDTRSADVKEMIEKLALRFDEGLWLVPSRGIPTVGLHSPLDLVYLDEEYRVIGMIESFPAFHIAPLSRPAASVLALPAHTIYTSQTQTDDHLVICLAEDMEARLREEHTKSQQPVEVNGFNLGADGMNSLRKRFEKWFSADNRKAKRFPSPQLAAYYWTGAAPVEHTIRDISSTGLFLLTDERWYPGTLVRMTLQRTDPVEEGVDRAIAVNSRAVRWGDDGVGLQFVLPEPQDQRRGSNPLIDGVDRKTLEKFLQWLRTGKR
ncbi:MAG: PilZ domain-containing protein [Terracidiphilus sp.]|jgi:uncharacterized membrane protein (UPF0127 family)